MLFGLLFTLIASVHSLQKVCPSGTFTCPDTATCCQLADQSYGCCPLESAVCCDDHIHCCPQHTNCEAGICIQLDGMNATAKRLSAKDTDIHCFGSKYLCPDNTTCCKGQEPDKYGCCPFKHGVCCTDGYHCCPEGTVCNLQELKCVGKDYVSEMYDSQKIKIQLLGLAEYLPLTKPDNVTSVFCPGSSFQCPNGYTCCKLPSGDWGCCPFVNATCCKDNLHCCPQNMQCDSTSQACFQGRMSFPSLLKKLSKPVNVGITCPDNSTCAEYTTCCELNNQHFGCCLYPDAVCCEDHSHCCPHDYICDVVERQCVPKQNWVYNSVFKYYKKLG